MTFKNDYGDYPPSGWHPKTSPDYCGAQKFTEALLGWDLLGFHPKSAWRADGLDTSGGLMTYDPLKTRDIKPIGNPDGVADTLNERKKCYLELATTNVFRLGKLFNNTKLLNSDTFVICDAFGVKKIKIEQTTIKAGTPILYYRANTSSKNINLMPLDNRIYDARHNFPLVNLGSVTKDGTPGKPHPLLSDGFPFKFFYGDFITGAIGYIQDPKIITPAPPWPYRPDSYLLISAGLDGKYGTKD
ncbi:unnamed protein product, partial [marine sediment metagenome]